MDERRGLNRRRMMAAAAGLLALPRRLAAAPLPHSRPAAPRELDQTRVIHHEAETPAAIWADVVGRPEDVAAARRLASAVMGDIHRKRSWALAWWVATRTAYRALYKPFGRYVRESDYLAGVLGKGIITPADMAGMQRLYTLAHGGCSTVLAWDETNRRMLHFRCLDWPSAEAIADATRIFAGRRQDGGDSYRAAGIVGMVGLLTAVKPGFSVAINFAPWTGPSLSLNPDPTFLVRKLMESPVATYQQAFEAISHWRPSAPVFISLCGVEKGEGAVFEFGAAWNNHGPCHVIPMGDRPFLVQTNHFAPDSPFAAHNRTQAPMRDWDDGDWDRHTILETSTARRLLIEQALAAGHGAGRPLEDVLREVYLKRPVWNPETAQWVAMTPGTGEMRVWRREAPPILNESY